MLSIVPGEEAFDEVELLLLPDLLPLPPLPSVRACGVVVVAVVALFEVPDIGGGVLEAFAVDSDAWACGEAVVVEVMVLPPEFPLSATSIPLSSDFDDLEDDNEEEEGDGDMEEAFGAVVAEEGPMEEMGMESDGILGILRSEEVGR